MGVQEHHYLIFSSHNPQHRSAIQAQQNMSSLATMLGLKSNGPLSSPPNNAPYHAIFNFLFAYVFLSSRFGERAVQEGKITRAQLNLLKRNEAAHANAME